MSREGQRATVVPVITPLLGTFVRLGLEEVSLSNF